MRYAVGCDHAGLPLKAPVIEELQAREIEVLDMGTHGPESVDYPSFAGKVARAVSRGEADMGVLICGTGLGMAIVANKFKGVRAVAVTMAYQAKMGRRHNDGNVICFGARVLGEGAALDALAAWLDEDFEGGRHERRVDLMNKAGDVGKRSDDRQEQRKASIE